MLRGACLVGLPLKNYGAENRIRTDDLRITNAPLYQLSYLGKHLINVRLIKNSLRVGNREVLHYQNQAIQMSFAFVVSKVYRILISKLDRVNHL